jgi:hypothetical protein
MISKYSVGGIWEFIQSPLKNEKRVPVMVKCEYMIMTTPTKEVLMEGAGYNRISCTMYGTSIFPLLKEHSSKELSKRLLVSNPYDWMSNRAWILNPVFPKRRPLKNRMGSVCLILEKSGAYICANLRIELTNITYHDEDEISYIRQFEEYKGMVSCIPTPYGFETIHPKAFDPKIPLGVSIITNPERELNRVDEGFMRNLAQCS